MTGFKLHSRLQRDCFEVGQFALSRILLMNDSHYPWIILVPQRQDIAEIFQLTPEDRQKLSDESCWLAEAMVDLYQPDKLNIAAIGNLVPQLHIHHVARFRSDIAWPSPVWGKFAAVSYLKEDADKQIIRLRERLQPLLVH